MMKLTDYVIDFLVTQGIRNVFGLTGGAVVHLFDSADRNPAITPIFCHHEQAAALAAAAYARVKNGLGAAIVTTGPGGTNAITGVTGAWQDSIPCIFLSGQSRVEHTTHGKSLRQLGSQELDIVSIVRPITKYAVMVEDPLKIRYHLEKAVYLATESRPGPVWIDLPLNFQWVSIEPDMLAGFNPDEIKQFSPPEIPIKELCKECYELLIRAERPLVFGGYGIRLARAEKELRQFVELLNIPFLLTWTASDIVSTDHSLFIGRPGIAGQRGANLAVQNCDLLICVGSHLSIPLTGTLFHAFAREAKIVMVDIAKEELEYQTVRVDLPIQCDAKLFFKEMLNQAPYKELGLKDWWLEKCIKYKLYNSVPQEWTAQRDYVNPYVFIDILSDELNDNDIIVVDGGGTVVYITFQAFKVKEKQRLILSSGIGAMGTGLPESVGACFASGGKRVICLCGDGSMQLNIQELQTIVHHNLSVKIFVFNNGGYLAIRHTQDGFLDGNYVGSNAQGGLSLPDFKKVAAAYGINSTQINNHGELRDKIRWTLENPGPWLCEVMINREQEMMPRQGFEQKPDGTFAPRPLEDMYPYLDRQEFLDNMIVAPWGGSERILKCRL